MHQCNRQILFCNERKGWRTVIFIELSINYYLFRIDSKRIYWILLLFNTFLNLRGISRSKQVYSYTVQNNWIYRHIAKNSEIFFAVEIQQLKLELDRSINIIMHKWATIKFRQIREIYWYSAFKYRFINVLLKLSVALWTGFPSQRLSHSL